MAAALVAVVVPASSEVVALGSQGTAAVLDGPVPRADCGPGSRIETALQGQVPLEDRRGGRSQSGYWCNLELIGQYQGEGASIQSAWYDRCNYYGTSLGGPVRNPGVQVLDVSDPAAPKVTARLLSPAMTEPWESLKVHEGRGLIAAVHGGVGASPVFFDVYDIGTDCTQPRLLSSLPLPSNIVGHDGAWAPDGKTYWVGMLGGLGAIDTSDPTRTSLVYADTSRVHGLSFSPDGNLAYLAVPAFAEGEPNGLRVVDVSDIQNRRPQPEVRTVSTLYWPDGAVAQQTIPITYGGRKFLVFVDEGGSRFRDRSEGGQGLRSPAGATRLIDISDLRNPQTASKVKLEIQMPEHVEEQRADTENNGVLGYQAHLCTVDRPADPTALACGYIQSGVRVFDIRDPYRPREIAYFNPPAQVGRQAQLPGSFHVSSPGGAGLNAMYFRDSLPQPNLTTDWCTSQVRFYAPRNELWTQCTDNGFLVLRFTNAAYPLPRLTTTPDPPAKPPPSMGTRAAPPTEGPRPSVSAERWKLAYACVIVPGLDDRSVKRLVSSLGPVSAVAPSARAPLPVVLSPAT